jgi:3-oxoadipate enol-lactonase
MKTTVKAFGPIGWEPLTKEQKVATDFGDLVVHVGGNEEGPTMVFWPSLLLDSSMWSYQIEHYAPNYRVVLIDPPGVGKSAPLRRVIGVHESAVCLRQVLDALKIETSIVVGNSWGSLAGAVFAAIDPKRLSALIITNGTAAPPTAEIVGQMTGVVDSLEQSVAMPDWLLGATQQAFSSNVDRPEFLAYLGRVLREDPVSIAFAMKGILLGREDLHPCMRKIRDVPVLVVAGEQDRVFDTSQSRDLAKSIRDSDFVLLPDTGHLAPRENPMAVNAAIDVFLEKRLVQD